MIDLFCRNLTFLAFFLCSACLFADNPFQWTALSDAQIEEWVGQFSLVDQPTARKLFSYIDYYNPDRVKNGLRNLHGQLLNRLKADGFNLEGEDPYANVDFSKLYCAKSGDLISYFYRHSNGLRASSFKNISDLVHDGESKDHRALVIIEDYVGTGTQFLWENYVKINYELFNQYSKIYLIALVANQVAIQRFNQVKTGQTDDYVDFLERMQVVLGNPMSRNSIVEALDRLGHGRLELLYDQQEISLLDRPDILPIDRASFAALLRQYTQNTYLEDLFSTTGYTVFFYNCPNNVPGIFWSSRNSPGWRPLFHRYEDLSIYECSEHIPIAEQIFENR